MSATVRGLMALETGIDLPDFSFYKLRWEIETAAARLRGPSRVLVFACKHGAAGGRQNGTVHLPCVAMLPPSVLDYAISRKLAAGVVIAGCAERDDKADAG